MPQRRINDAQVERLLSALQSLPYRQELAHKLAKKENIKYSSAMRRLQRYITKGAQKRTFARAPLDIRRATIKTARRLPVPIGYEPLRREPKQMPLPVERARPTFYREIEPLPGLTPTYKPRAGHDAPDNFDYRALLAYFDGDADEAAEALSGYGAPARTAAILELTAKSVDVLGMRGAGRLSEAVQDFYEDIDSADLQDLDDFSDLLRQGNFPEWMQEIMLEDLMNSESSFADWMDAWREDNMIFRSRGEMGDDELEDSAFWEMWRAAYGRAKK